MDRENNNKTLIKVHNILELDLRIGRLKKAMQPFSFVGKNILKDYRQTVIHQLEIVLDCAILFGTADLKENINTYSTVYIEKDFSNKYYATSHSRYQDIRKALTLWFKSKVVISGEIISIEGSSYYDLVRERFDTREEAQSVLFLEIEAAELVMKLIENYPRLLKLPFGIGSQWVVDLFSRELQSSEQQITKELRRIYNG